MGNRLYTADFTWQIFMKYSH